MICSTLKTSASHGSNYLGVRFMGRTTNEHLAWLDLRENSNTPSGSVLPYLVWDKDFDRHVRWVLTLCHTAMTLKPGYTREKLLARHTKQGQVLPGQRLRMLYVLGTHSPKPWAQSQALASQKPWWSVIRYLIPHWHECLDCLGQAICNMAMVTLWLD
jgi:hypothetical protein